MWGIEGCEVWGGGGEGEKWGVGKDWEGRGRGKGFVGEVGRICIRVYPKRLTGTSI